MSRVQSRGSRVKVEVEVEVEVEGKFEGRGYIYIFPVSNFFDICLNNKVHEVR